MIQTTMQNIKIHQFLEIGDFNPQKKSKNIISLYDIKKLYKYGNNLDCIKEYLQEVLEQIEYEISRNYHSMNAGIMTFEDFENDMFAIHSIKNDYKKMLSLINK